ncbi:hypothetical protein V6N12_003654 [Hibiscus sabdariffa]|uniref:Uncharacterized protein n=1 Tax=Hibiscus sabdariffa TaxID=183260 RepID=A0ABR2AF62_9ROSI
MFHNVGSTTQHLVPRWLEPLHDPSTAYCTEALHHNVENSSGERKLPCQEKTKLHNWVDAQAMPWIPTPTHLEGAPCTNNTHDGQRYDVKEQESDYEFNNPSSPERPRPKLTKLEKWSWRGSL